MTWSQSATQEVPNAAWQLHTYIPYSTGAAAGPAGSEILTYGCPQGLYDFCNQAQIANYVQYRLGSGLVPGHTFT